MEPNYNESRIVFDAGFNAMPLHRFDAMVTVKGKRKQAGKRPLDNKWTTKLYNNAEVLAEAEKHGRNLGVRLTATQLVVDVDPRNFGLTDEAKERLKEPEIKATLDAKGNPTAATKALMGASWVEHTLTSKGNPLERLLDDCGMALDDYPRVETGSGGYHIYMAKPATLSVKDSLPEYPGIEYKSLGRQVVAPGSIHPDTGRHYVVVQDAFACFKALSQLPQKLSERIGHSRNNQDWSERARRALDGSVEYARTRVDAGQIGELLKWVAIPSGQGDYLDWVMFLMAAHFASNGDFDVLTELEGWVDEEAEIQDRWGGFGQYDGSPVTFGTLARLALQYCLPEHKAEVEAWIVKVRAASDFAMIESEAEVEEFLEELEQATRGDAANGLTNALSNGHSDLAENFLRTRSKMLRHDGHWLEYDAKQGCYEVHKEPEGFEAEVWNFLRDRPYKDGKGETKTIRENTAIRSNVVAALQALSQGPKALPAWNYRGKKVLPEATDMMAVSNGLVHIPSRRLLPPTPMFVTTVASAAFYDPSAKCPLWEKCLREWFTPEEGPNRGILDVEAVQLLQEYMGYCLSQDTRYQKFLYMQGHSRSGKGTILRILQMLMGKKAMESVTPDSLVDTFGLEQIEDALVAVFPDLRNMDKRGMNKLLQLLLKIVGEDGVPINRKHKKIVSRKLLARIIIASNDLLNFHDASSAIINRILVLQFFNDFSDGRENVTLTDELALELSGILNWALDGLDRLRARKHFVQPASANDLVHDLKARTSPVKTFIDSMTVRERDNRVPKVNLIEAFKVWCKERDLDAISDSLFFRQLKVNYPNYKAEKPRIGEGGKQEPCIVGLRLIDDPICLPGEEDFDSDPDI